MKLNSVVGVWLSPTDKQKERSRRVFYGEEISFEQSTNGSRHYSFWGGDLLFLFV